jgi:hypothetical protein
MGDEAEEMRTRYHPSWVRLRIAHWALPLGRTPNYIGVCDFNAELANRSVQTASVSTSTNPDHFQIGAQSVAAVLDH